MTYIQDKTPVVIDKRIFNTAKTDYGSTKLFFGESPGLMDTIHRNHPKLWSLFKKLRKQDWDEEEFDFSSCVEEFRTCPSAIADRMLNTLVWQWESDTIASRSIAAIMAPFCTAMEVWVPYVRINDNENVHALTYSDIVKGSFVNPDEVLGDLLQKVEPMKRLEVIGKVFADTYYASHAYATGTIEETQELHNTLYTFLVGVYLLERVQFMQSFAETFDICRKGYFPPIRSAVEKIAMDEYEIHAQFGQEVLKIVLGTLEGTVFYSNCRDIIIKMLNEVYHSELAFIEWNRQDGDIDGYMTKDDVIHWLWFNLTAAATFLSIKEDEVDFTFVTKNPIPWIKSHLNIADNQASPQEEDANQYMVNIFRRDDVGVPLNYNHDMAGLFSTT